VERFTARRPAQNGSGGTTLEVLIALTVIGAGALAVLPWLASSPRSEDAEKPGDRDNEKDGNG
jgi:Tfp pilus assembly protein PilV